MEAKTNPLSHFLNSNIIFLLDKSLLGNIHHSYFTTKQINNLNVFIKSLLPKSTNYFPKYISQNDFNAFNDSYHKPLKEKMLIAQDYNAMNLLRYYKENNDLVKLFGESEDSDPYENYPIYPSGLDDLNFLLKTNFSNWGVPKNAFIMVNGELQKDSFIAKQLLVAIGSSGNIELIEIFSKSDRNGPDLIKGVIKKGNIDNIKYLSKYSYFNKTIIIDRIWYSQDLKVIDFLIDYFEERKELNENNYRALYLNGICFNIVLLQTLVDRFEKKSPSKIDNYLEKRFAECFLEWSRNNNKVINNKKKSADYLRDKLGSYFNKYAILTKYNFSHVTWFKKRIIKYYLDRELITQEEFDKLNKIY